MCHIANVTIDLLRTEFENRIVSLWLPRSCDSIQIKMEDAITAV